MSHYFHPTAFTDKVLAVLGPRFLGPLAIIRIWRFCLFYVMAELSARFCFGDFANQVYLFFLYFLHLFFTCLFNFYLFYLEVWSCSVSPEIDIGVF